MKEMRQYFDSRSGTTFNVNVRTRIVRDRSGAYPDDETAARVLKAVEARIRSGRNRAERDDVLRSLGMVKVRGSVSGSTYWE